MTIFQAVQEIVVFGQKMEPLTHCGRHFGQKWLFKPQCVLQTRKRAIFSLCRWAIKLLQSAKMISSVVLLLVLLIISGNTISGTIQFPQLPSQWQDQWHLGLQDDTLTIEANSIAANFRTIEISQFLDETSVISAHMQNRCNICHVVKELHPNVLSMQVSNCLSQVWTVCNHKYLTWIFYAKNLISSV